MKIAWQLLTKEKAIWVKILKEKYKFDPLREIPKHKTSCSNLWGGLCKIWNSFSDHTMKVVRNGEDTKFWLDYWIPRIACLSPLVVSTIPQNELQKNTISYVIASGEWNWGTFAHFLPNFCVASIENIKPPSRNYPNDSFAWDLTNDGCFTVKDWDITLLHVCRDNNVVVNTLAKLGHNLPLGARIFKVPPTACMLALREDRSKAGLGLSSRPYFIAKRSAYKISLNPMETENPTIIVPFESRISPPTPDLPELPLELPSTLILNVLGAGAFHLTNPLYAFAMGSLVWVFFVTDHEEIKEKTKVYAASFVELSVMSLVINVSQHYCFAYMGEYLTKRVRERMLSKILTFEVGWFDEDESSSGAVCSRLAKDANVVRSLATNLLNSNNSLHNGPSNCMEARHSYDSRSTHYAGSMTSDLAKGADSVGSVFAILDRHTKIEPNDPNGYKPDKSLTGLIELNDVYFLYPARPRVLIFQGFSMRIEAGKSTALVGHSGSGKSTIIGLIQTFYDPQKGTVNIDGKDIKSYQLRSYREHIALVSQEPSLFAGTIIDNIAYGASQKVDEAEIIEAARAANAHEFITRLRDGYDTWCGDRGVQLSGGEKQRIAIARAIVKNPRVLLLEEAYRG
ncbi:ABC transporter B family member 15-like [Senna tora]|uniref:ABC transporter B family member 15-like n=1 Tax=Senna tora TaxID=362788 RepID=A0A834ST14_9FABA|nr:ABC transporter B family member 15-like [Senna tora]